MGNRSNAEKTKITERGENGSLRYVAMGMQGWRMDMEDAHMAHTDLPDGLSLFGVFDGHAGKFAKKFYFL